MKLSIISINKNDASGLNMTISSVFNQTNRDFEYIIIDGASTDGSLDIIHNYLNRSEGPQTFKWVSELDSGIYNAMNKGIQLSSGEYLLFLNSGDCLSSNNVIDIIQKELFNADIVIAKCNMIENGRIVWTYVPKDSYSFGTLFFYGIAHQSSFIKKSLFDQFGLYDDSYRFNGDIEFWYRTIIDNNVSTQALSVVVSDYKLGGMSDQFKDNPTFLEEHRRILSKPAYERFIGDYEQWKKERDCYRKYQVVEHYPLVISFLNRLERVKRLFHKACFRRIRF